MELAGKKELKGVDVERKGLGTPATRAGIIESLIKKELIERDGKKLLSTDKGRELVSVVAEFLKSSETTSNWELKVYDISKGDDRLSNFIKEIKRTITNIILQDKVAG